MHNFAYNSGGFLPRRILKSTATIHKNKKIKKRIFAISTAAPAILVKPSKPAIIAIINSESDQSNILAPILLIKKTKII